jgi:hypothetical protein
MNVLYIILYLLAAVCFLIVFVSNGPERVHRTLTSDRLVALGLFLWVLVPFIVAARAL